MLSWFRQSLECVAVADCQLKVSDYLGMMPTWQKAALGAGQQALDNLLCRSNVTGNGTPAVCSCCNAKESQSSAINQQAYPLLAIKVGDPADDL